MNINNIMHRLFIKLNCLDLMVLSQNGIFPKASPILNFDCSALKKFKFSIKLYFPPLYFSI